MNKIYVYLFLLAHGAIYARPYIPAVSATNQQAIDLDDSQPGRPLAAIAQEEQARTVRAALNQRPSQTEGQQVVQSTNQQGERRASIGTVIIWFLQEASQAPQS